MERKLYKLVKKHGHFIHIVFCVLFCRLTKKELCLTQALERVLPATKVHLRISGANGYDIKWDCIWFYEKDKYNIPGMSRPGPVRKNEVPVLYGYSQDLGV